MYFPDAQLCRKLRVPKFSESRRQNGRYMPYLYLNLVVSVTSWWRLQVNWKLRAYC